MIGITSGTYVFGFDSENEYPTFTLADHEIARKMTLGEWNKLRLIALFSIVATNSTISNPELVFGLNSGITELRRSPACVHFAGIVSNAASWVPTPGTDPTSWSLPMGNIGSAWSAMTKIGTTVATQAGASVSGVTAYIPHVYAGGDPSAGTRLAVLGLDIERGDGTFTFSWAMPTQLDADTDKFTPQYARTARTVALEDFGTHFSSDFEGVGTATIAVDEEDGILDTFLMSWNGMDPTAMLNYIMFSRLE